MFWYVVVEDDDHVLMWDTDSTFLDSNINFSIGNGEAVLRGWGEGTFTCMLSRFDSCKNVMVF